MEWWGSTLLFSEQVFRLCGGLWRSRVPVPQEHPRLPLHSLRRHVHPRYGGEQEEQSGHCRPRRRHCSRHDQIHLFWQGVHMHRLITVLILKETAQHDIFLKVAELEGKATGLLSAAEKYDLRGIREMMIVKLTCAFAGVEDHVRDSTVRHNYTGQCARYISCPCVVSYPLCINVFWPTQTIFAVGAFLWFSILMQTCWCWQTSMEQVLCVALHSR